MNPDDLKHAWQAQTSQTRLTINPELLLNELRRNQQQFNAMIFWRDAREIGVGLVMIPIWLMLGIKLSLPWAWYLMIPALVWIPAFMLIDRRRHSRISAPSESLYQCAENSLAEVEHQTWLLRNVHWWYLLPFAIPMLAFFVHLGWELRGGGWWMVVSVAGLILINGLAFTAIYRLNQHAVRATLDPRRQELQVLLANLCDESTEAG